MLPHSRALLTRALREQAMDDWLHRTWLNNCKKCQKIGNEAHMLSLLFDVHFAAAVCTSSRANARRRHGQYNIFKDLAVRCKLWLERGDIIVVQGMKQAVKARASTDAHVLPEVSLAMQFGFPAKPGSTRAPAGQDCAPKP
jgi:hypothetical protein